MFKHSVEFQLTNKFNKWNEFAVESGMKYRQNITISPKKSGE